MLAPGLRCAPSGLRGLSQDGSLRRGALCLWPTQMLVQPRHDLHEIARPGAVIELLRQNAVPAVAAGARRSRQTEDESRAGSPGGGAALDSRSPYFGVAQHMEGDRKAVHAFFE